MQGMVDVTVQELCLSSKDLEDHSVSHFIFIQIHFAVMHFSVSILGMGSLGLSAVGWEEG